jgi:hypothetical protein
LSTPEFAITSVIELQIWISGTKTEHIEVPSLKGGEQILKPLFTAGGFAGGLSISGIMIALSSEKCIEMKINAALLIAR